MLGDHGHGDRAAVVPVTVGADTQITDLAVNDHACLTFGESEELFDLTAAFIRDGLAGGLKVLWLSDSAPGQAAMQLSGRGIAIEPAVAAGQMTVSSCDRERFDPVTLASVAGRHTRSVAAATYYQDAVLRICRQYAPPGIRVAGEIDYHAEEPLALALAEALRMDGDITINLADLTFIDVSSIRMIVNLARSLPLPRRVILQCPPAIAGKFSLLGADSIGSIRLVTVDDR